MNENKPDFFSVGPSKTGTSWQLHHFCRHPQITYPIIKDINFFDEADLFTFIQMKAKKEEHSRIFGNYFDLYDGANLKNYEFVLGLRQKQQQKNYQSVVNMNNLKRWQIKQLIYGIRFRLLKRDLEQANIDRYCNWLFKKEKGKIAGDLSTQYFKLSSHAIERIANNFPKLKIIMGIRNPVERKWSYLRMNHQLEGKTTSIFNIDSKLLDYPDPDSDYKSAITNWTRYFPKNQIHFAFFDEMQTSPHDYLKDIYDFLEIDFKKEMVDPGFRNKGMESDIPKEVEDILAEKFADQFEFLSAYFPGNKYLGNWKHNLKPKH